MAEASPTVSPEDSPSRLPRSSSRNHTQTTQTRSAFRYTGVDTYTKQSLEVPS